MKNINKLLLRKLFKNKFLLLGLSVLVIVGVAFFVTLFTISLRYEETGETYFKDYSYADCTFYGSFEEQRIAAVKNQGAEIAEGRFVKDYRNSGITYRAISQTKNINTLYYYYGSAPKQGECAILKKNADALNLKIGDSFTLNGQNLQVSAIIGSPEYIYLVKNDRSMMSDPSNFAVIFLNESFFEGNFDEILVKNLSANFNNKEINNLIKAKKSVMQSQQLNYTGFRADLDQIKTFAFIFPAIFAVLIFVMVYVVLKRMAAKERKQIAVYKALGLRWHEIIKAYLSQFAITFFIAAIIGCAITLFIVNLIIGMFTSMFELPLLSYHFYPWLWAGSVAAALTLCIIPGLLSLRDVLNIEPAEAMRPKIERGGRKILLEKTPFWKKFSFNTRYTFKSMFRSKARFLSIILGILGATALLLVSLGFNDSINSTRDEYFRKFANYDAVVNFEPIPFSDPVESISYLSKEDEYAKALQMETEVNDTDCNLTIIDNDFDFLNLDYSLLKDGIIIPEYYATLWNVKKGDSLLIEGAMFKISGIIKQTMALSLYISYDDFTLLTGNAKDCNTLFIRSDNLTTLTDYFNSNGLNYSTIEDDTATFNAVSGSLSMLIWIMLLCALILGITVLYTVGLMNLSARENEYMLLSTLGYSRKKIMLCYIKETVIQIILALPLGILAGILILAGIRGQFSNSSFVLKTSISFSSYLFTFIIVAGLAAIMYFVTKRQIGKIDIVQGLKAQDD